MPSPTPIPGPRPSPSSRPDSTSSSPGIGNVAVSVRSPRGKAGSRCRVASAPRRSARSGRVTTGSAGGPSRVAESAGPRCVWSSTTSFPAGLAERPNRRTSAFCADFTISTWRGRFTATRSWIAMPGGVSRRGCPASPNRLPPPPRPYPRPYPRPRPRPSSYPRRRNFAITRFSPIPGNATVTLASGPGPSQRRTSPSPRLGCDTRSPGVKAGRVPSGRWSKE